ncbi:unnamed protein product [Ranitomeya imitator]|uniref:ribonuclease H n=1 Tax=Ranitomeya imitator TaxID=111125 RepID=A0ABN9LSI1_9NEOB|nr:unnamed protein product [Ranitomeya imitator]
MFTLVTRVLQGDFSIVEDSFNDAEVVPLIVGRWRELSTVLHVILSLTDCPPCYSLPHRLSSMLFSPSHTVLHVILSLTDCPPCYSLPHSCPPCYSLPHRLSSMLFSPSQTDLHVILSLTDCPPSYSLPHRLTSMLFSPLQTVLHVILSLTDCPPCYSLPHRLSSMLFSPSHTVLHLILSLTDCPPCYSLPHRLSSMLFSPSQTVLHVILVLVYYPIPLRGIDATPLAKNKPQYWTQLTMCMAPAHQEDIRFLVLHNLHDVVVLGLPWLQVHNPVLDWKSMSVSSWGCQGVHGDVPFLSISSSTPSEVPEFLSDYRDVFDEPNSSALPPHRDCDCAIDLIPGSKFPKGRLFNLSVPEHAAMRSYVKESLEKGHIRPSSSPLGAGFFFVAKKDGSLRPCIDYRLLNKITVKFQYPLPLLSDLFARIKGASWFTKIDLRGAYNLVRIKQGDEWETAFNTPEGHFEYLVMPFGLSNAPSVFQSFMHDIFREYLDKFLIVYLDDILVFSDDWESHVKQVRMVFQVLRANSLFVKGSKCLFGVQKVSFLGFIFSPSTIEMDPVKVQAIYDWTQPTSLKSLQKFLGFANFYRRFINNFSSIAKPLTDLTKKGADVVNWSSAALEAFQELKCRFSSSPVLCQPDVSLPFQVEVDASEIGAGAVLSQRSSDGSVMKPCAFFSRKFSPAERNYDVGNRELLAMKWAFEEWRYWLEGAKHRVVVLTDHKNLTYLESAKQLNPRQARWSLFFSHFDFVVSYLPGSKNVKADALSRSFVPDSPGLPEPAGILKEGVESSDCPGVDTVVDRLQQIWTHVVDNLTLSQEKAQRFANRRRCVGPRLRVGDLVWLSSRYIPMKVSSPKFKPRFIGPYRISEVLKPVSFRLTLPDSFSIHNVFHRSLLRRYVAPVVPSVDPPAPVLVEGELEYIVEKILDSRISRRKLQYLVKWKGYDQEDNSWVFASDVHAADLVRAFHLAHPGRPGGSACYIGFSCLLEALRRRGSTEPPVHNTSPKFGEKVLTRAQISGSTLVSQAKASSNGSLFVFGRNPGPRVPGVLPKIVVMLGNYLAAVGQDDDQEEYTGNSLKRNVISNQEPYTSGRGT